jgi:hypothetical protein
VASDQFRSFLVPKLLLRNPLVSEALLRSKPGALKSGSVVAKQELGVQVRSQAGAWERVINRRGPRFYLVRLRWDPKGVIED